MHARHAHIGMHASKTTFHPGMQVQSRHGIVHRPACSCRLLAPAAMRRCVHRELCLPLQSLLVHNFSASSSCLLGPLQPPRRRPSQDSKFKGGSRHSLPPGMSATAARALQADIGPGCGFRRPTACWSHLVRNRASRVYDSESRPPPPPPPPPSPPPPSCLSVFSSSPFLLLSLRIYSVFKYCIRSLGIRPKIFCCRTW